MESGEYRFIPAGAGNTQKVPVVPDERPVYPRWRGEHRAHFRKIQIIHGLSPLARGTHRSGMIEDTANRFIPAGAENTAAGEANTFGASVYPRWRGEHGNFSSNSLYASGLSPLARGTRI
ncbi:hypothetical protein SEEH0134_17144 [Salmonella enterica subsp. enterica serovar Heidelberg str. N20134]|nr:hypothetical protein SEEH1579_15384 [Salmonella enterica subsp. enterica serovar Heidelberg str. 41579]EIC35085.1 hypothetical protein SEEH1563_12921 [Salmonella enterica subsp. enterica serovar Heidelberg str. 41563]EIC47257.1 hypothetical protein SEEH1565_14057 [Salmonella enterica subsp. enterica serovar Heidelberg str. 41565]EIC47894.1 hypothetical protein SEEH1573_23096 [Salmonella enterica subsp. enterica serovar Heidelberg str. 41573]EIC55917.1 hypothetical protein SEEH1566_19727 [Sal